MRRMSWLSTYTGGVNSLGFVKQRSCTLQRLGTLCFPSLDSGICIVQGLDGVEDGSTLRNEKGIGLMWRRLLSGGVSVSFLF